eukprot:TRINITY_DN554_c0_g1_i2.p1 TRINITY_DN554_c0_g1~~TRINITY_DN554_c0_g1_i2.p1  ORF type:complete len:138 (+),score=33.86 TRINITY_DN554_c0_g1_i2:144-557(+)
MGTLRTFLRILLGLTLIAAGGLLLAYYDPSDSLPKLLKGFPPLAGLAPYYLQYFRVCASLFCVSGLLTIFNSRLAEFAQLVASLMYCLTFNNLALCTLWEIRVQKAVYILCHVVLVAAICECHCEKIQGEPEKVKID